MRYYVEEKYSKDFLEKLDNVSFPLTYDMCVKNDFEGMIVRMFLDQELQVPLSIVIYEEIGKKEIHIYSFEVHKVHQLKKIGRQVLNKFKENNKFIELSSLPEAKIFYEKQGFIDFEGNHMRWYKNG